MDKDIHPHTYKELAYKMLIMLRTLFVVTMTWDFFLTVGFYGSQRALILTGALVAPYIPIIIGVWALLIVGMIFILIYGTYGSKECEGKITTLAYILLSSCFVLYSILLILALLNPVITWPVILTYIINIGWIMSLIYFRREYNRLKYKSQTQS